MYVFCTLPQQHPRPWPITLFSLFPPFLVPADPTKFFGIELGAQTQMDDAIGRYIVNGQHTAEDLSKLLDKFIKKFVLCAKCGNPETDMVRRKQGLVWEGKERHGNASGGYGAGRGNTRNGSGG